MFKIVTKRVLNPTVVLMEIEAPQIAKKMKAGQFIILRINEYGERVPFTVEDTNTDRGTVTIVFQIVGKTTLELSRLNAGDSIQDFVGPLGQPTTLDGMKKVAVIGGGLGCAIAFPQAKHLFQSGVKVDIIAGFRSKEIVILEDEMKKASNRLLICTDDGTYGKKGFVTDALEAEIKAGAGYDHVIAIGPLPMMKFVSLLTKKYEIPTIVSMNPIMIDGTGMCGCCRVTVAGKTRFACVEGPDFDGHQIDFDEAIERMSTYKKEEKAALDHYCRLENISM
ncbi:MAG TPA: sulfide/dihydroorotate dehydrogenase-like FAD/NAD-binding protein [Ruminococcaceae bacterium]|nr:sulfide/dihydroorotate dehydrogenase-like FAD/NAD-binding protein [Oscillospiraceae bacterium]